jgi:phosphoglycolate phosphatase
MLLFDLDGTLWDSAANVAEAWNIIFAREDPTLPKLTKDDVHSVMGLTMKEIQDRLHPSLPEARRSAVFDECCRYEVEYLREHGGEPYPFLRTIMEKLISDGYKLGIVSNCQCGYVDAFLSAANVRDLFCDYEEWERTGLVKGENIRLVMRRNGFDKAIYIGDTQKDQDAAILAGIPFIHAAYGFGKVSNPNAVIHSLSDLPDVLTSF